MHSPTGQRAPTGSRPPIGCPARPLSGRPSRARRRGQALVEFALIVPIMLLLLVIAIDFGRLFYTYLGVTNAAREGAAFAIAGVSNPLCVTASDCPDPGNITFHARQELAGDPNLQVTVTCAPYANCRSSNGVGGTAGNRVTVSTKRAFTLLTPVISTILGKPFNIGASTSAVIP